MIPDVELDRMRWDAEALASLRLDERGKPVPMAQWGSRSYRFRPEADVLTLLDALAAERAQVTKLKTELIRERNFYKIMQNVGDYLDGKLELETVPDPVEEPRP